MVDRLQALILRFLRVPPVPAPPAGASGSVRVFRAGKNYYKLRLLAWGAKQLLTLVGILFSVGLLLRLEYDMALHRATPTPTVRQEQVVRPDGANREKAPPRQTGESFERNIALVAARAPWWVLPLVTVVKVAGILLYLVQIPLTYAAVRLDYEQRWYIVTDRSLRIREGIWRVQELTMSFANLQQVVVTQGPLQRLLALGDVRVQSAGGGSGYGEKQQEQGSLHLGIFHGVANAAEIRDVILERLQRFRAAGLGDPDDHVESEPSGQKESADVLRAHSDAAAAARELLDSAKALRAAWTSPK